MPEVCSATPSAFVFNDEAAVNYPKKMTDVYVQSPALFDTVDEAVKACVVAQAVWKKAPATLKSSVIENIRKRAKDSAKDLAWAAWSETGMGRYEDKIGKNILAAEKTPGLEDLGATSYTGDHGLTVLERAPFGVIGAVTPVTNPTSTVINNAISILAGGNGLVINPHPNGKQATCRAIAMVNAAIVEAGGPVSLVTGISKPTAEGAQELFKHPLTAANLVTGGPAVVKIAMTSGKRSICAGPGNPPIVVDESADLEYAAAGIIKGAGFDNNMICLDEKSLFVVESVADKLTEELKKAGAYILSPEEVKKIESVIFMEPTKEYEEIMINKAMVGQNVSVILKEIGVTVGDECRIAVAPVPKSHSLVWTEQLMPVLPLVRCADSEAAMELAKKSEHGFRHTACIYSRNIGNITAMGRLMDTTIFVKNGPCIAGLGVDGEGFTSFSIAGTTGEGMTRPRTFCRERRCAYIDALRMV